MSVKKKKGAETDPASQEAEPLDSAEAERPEPDGTPVEPGAAEQPGADVPVDVPDRAAEDPVGALTARVGELEAALAESRDQLLRRAADFENTRKRLLRDKEESVRYANTALLADLVEAIDGLERAISSAESSRDFDALHEGVVLIERQLMSSLENKWGLARMKARGAPFDPTQHQAVSVGGSLDGDVPVVLEELQSGYVLNGRVLRPARVVVSAPRPPAEGAEAASPAGPAGD